MQQRVYYFEFPDEVEIGVLFGTMKIVVPEMHYQVVEGKLEKEITRLYASKAEIDKRLEKKQSLFELTKDIPVGGE